MKNRLVLLILLSLASSGIAFAGKGHDHKEDDGMDDFSGIEIEESHDDHGDEGHQHKEEGHGHKDDGHEEKGHDHGDGHGHGHGEAASDAELSADQRRMAGIETMKVKSQSLGDAITAPGEVILNAYRTTKVTPRTPAQVIKRHARLGDHVKKGQPLVTLSSVEMAESQGALMKAHTELRRVEKLGRKVVSEKRFVTAQIAYQQAFAKVKAYGMTEKQIKSLIKTGDATHATGEFRLLSFQNGTVISDDFVVGELIEPGYELMTISDESVLWIEARLTPEDTARIAVGSPAQVQIGKRWLSGKVTRERHTLDETTRTLAVHIEVANKNDEIHPGQFVHVVIEGNNKRQGIVVPVEAVLRSPDGDWQVFVETAQDRFEPREVKILKTVGNQILIEGIAEGTTIVGKGAFFVQSQMAKGGFDPHNH